MKITSVSQSMHTILKHKWTSKAALVFILFCFISDINAQSIRKSWYPLEKGNYWEYTINMSGIYIEYGIFSKKVMGDTIINDKTYSIIKKEYLSGYYTGYSYQFLRLENNKLYEYSKYECSPERLKIDFTLQDSVMWQPCPDDSIRVGMRISRELYIDGNDTLERAVFKYGQKYEGGFLDLGCPPSFISYTQGVGYMGGDEDDGLTGYIINGVKFGTITSFNDNEKENLLFELNQNYPNPFNPNTTIKYSIPNAGMVTLKVFDVLGKEVTTLVNEEKSAGSYSVNFNAANLPSGVYFYCLKSGGFVETKKLLLLK